MHISSVVLLKNSEEFTTRLAGFSPSNNLLKFIGFVSEKVVKAKLVGKKIRTNIFLRKFTRIYQASFDIIQLKNFKISLKDSHQS